MTFSGKTFLPPIAFLTNYPSFVCKTLTDLETQEIYSFLISLFLTQWAFYTSVRKQTALHFTRVLKYQNYA